MHTPPDFHTDILNIHSDTDFEKMAIKVFNYQYANSEIYREYCQLLGLNPARVTTLTDIPFLPISFFKTHRVVTGKFDPEVSFSSSGTTGSVTSRHNVKSLRVYESSFLEAFKLFYGSPSDYIVLGLLPSYLEREGSSLVYMVDQLIKRSNQPESGFYLHNLEELASFLKSYQGRKKIFLIGVSYALIDLAENHDLNLSEAIVMETGGMKGKRKELTKDELHAKLKKGLNLNEVHSEYGMTELLSQAYAGQNGLFSCPPWMKVLIRETNDPFSYTSVKSGGINVIDLANIHSCSFIATQDLGRYEGDYFKILGRFDHSDIRGCNLLVE